MNPQVSKLRADASRSSMDGILAYLDDLEALTRPSSFVPSNAADATNDLTLTAGACRNASNDGVIQSASSWTGALDGAVGWTKGSGAGVQKRSTATAVADTTWHLHVLGSLKNRLAFDIGFDTSVTAANLLADANVIAGGFDRYRRVFSFRRIGGVNQAFTALEISGGGLEVLLKTPAFDFTKSWAGGADDTAQTGTLALVPSGVQLNAILGIVFADISPAAASALLVTAIDQTDTAADATIASYIGTLRIPPAGAGVNAAASSPIYVRTSASGTFRYRAIASTTDHRLGVTTQGWIDARAA